jgi:hypothetical protein
VRAMLRLLRRRRPNMAKSKGNVPQTGTLATGEARQR